MEKPNEKLAIDFERELGKSSFPFKKIIEQSYNAELREQFAVAEMIPSFDLYLKQHYTGQQLTDGFSEANGKIPESTGQAAANFVSLTPFEIKLSELQSEFTQLLVKNKLPANFYCHNISQTPIVKTLVAVGDTLKILQKSIFNSNIDIYKEAEVRATSIKSKLQNIKGTIAKDVVNEIISENENFELTIYGIGVGNKLSNYSECVDKWASLKDTFNVKLMEFEFPSVDDEVLSNNQDCVSDVWPIDDELLNWIKNGYGISTLSFGDGCDDMEIVPHQFTHNELMNGQIDESVLNYYYLPTASELTGAEFAKMVKTGYAGCKGKALTPYSIIIFGAYYARMDLFWKLKTLQDETRNIFLNEKCGLKFMSDLIPYFKEYAKGFKAGYEGFLKDKVEQFLPMGYDKHDVAENIFKYVTADIPFTKSWKNNHSGFNRKCKACEPEQYISSCYEDGQKQGYFYRAWQEIFSANHLYAALFNKLYEHPEIEKNKLKNTTVKTDPLKAIWLPQAKISIEDFYKKGIDAGIWDENQNITCKRGSIYGTGKVMLGSLAIALKGYAISNTIDYKIVGKALCERFKIELKEKTENPYKTFSSTNTRYIKELKRVFVGN